jgi:16S rRNA (adenine1518-N6/adenine1519-N6)-dimethyltransferase
MTLSARDVAAHFERAGASPSRALGQNFVIDPNTVRKIARLAEVGPTTPVVEIGAGLGSLTLALAETGAQVTAVEIDRHLIEQLTANTAQQPNVTVVHADAMTLDWAALLGPASNTASNGWTLVANLPYNVATPLVADLLDGVPAITRMLVMVQREVGERFAAVPRTPAYGAVSVKVAYWARAEVVGIVPPSVFLPRPKIDSALVRIVRHRVPAVASDPGVLFALVRAGFAHRRKMLRGSLRDLVPNDAWDHAGVRPEQRAEELDIAAWGRLADAVSARAEVGQ